MGIVTWISHRAEINNAVQEATERALEIMGGKAETYAKKACRHDTGLLRNSITHARAGKAPAISQYTSDTGDTTGEYNGNAPGSSSDNTMYVGTNVEYAPHNEYGTSRMSAQPFLRPAAENHAEEYKTIWQNELSKIK